MAARRLAADPAGYRAFGPAEESGKLYESIWNREMNESPLRTFTRAQAEKLAAELARKRA
jgi:protoheme ferro-lyase